LIVVALLLARREEIIKRVSDVL